jgi:hypothetical protein
VRHHVEPTEVGCGSLERMALWPEHAGVATFDASAVLASAAVPKQQLVHRVHHSVHACLVARSHQCDHTPATSPQRDILRVA